MLYTVKSRPSYQDIARYLFQPTTSSRKPREKKPSEITYFFDAELPKISDV